MEIEVTTESDRVIEMAAGIQPDVVATELGLGGPQGRQPGPPAPRRGAALGDRGVDPPARSGPRGAGARQRRLRLPVEGGRRRRGGPRHPGRRRPDRSCSPAAPRRCSAATSAARSPGSGSSRSRSATWRPRWRRARPRRAQFLANISHELRTPVTVAKGIAHVLQQPERERGGAVGVHRAAAVVARPAGRAGGRDHRDHRARAGDVRAEHRVHRPGAADRQGGRRHGASAPVGPGRLADPREPVRAGRRGQDPRRDPRAPGERLPLLARRPVGRDPCPRDGARASSSR